MLPHLFSFRRSMELLLVAMLVGCAAQPPVALQPSLGGSGAMGETRSGSAGTAGEAGGSVRNVAPDAADGPAVLVSSGMRMPDASGFSTDPQQPVQNGRLILTARSLIWQPRTRFGAFSAPQRIPFTDIRSVALARADTRRLLVIEGPGMRHETFALTQPDGHTLDAAGTELAWQRLLALLGLRPPRSGG